MEPTQPLKFADWITHPLGFFAAVIIGLPQLAWVAVPKLSGCAQLAALSFVIGWPIVTFAAFLLVAFFRAELLMPVTERIAWMKALQEKEQRNADILEKADDVASKNVELTASKENEQAYTQMNIIESFTSISEFRRQEEDVRKLLKEIRLNLAYNDITTLRRLKELVSTDWILARLRSLYAKLLFRPIDPVAVASHGAFLLNNGDRPEVLARVEAEIRLSPEYQQKHKPVYGPTRTY